MKDRQLRPPISDNAIATMMHQAGLRPSVQRLSILSFILNSGTHPSAEEIFRELSPSMPTLSRTTIYNTLHILEEKNLIRQVNIEPDMVRYDFALYAPHAHFKCLRCGRITDLTGGFNPAPLPSGYMIDSVDLFYKGLCPECNKANNSDINNPSTLKQ